MRITRELDKEFPMYFDIIYTRESWSVLVINNPILKYICCFIGLLHYYYKINIFLISLL